MSESRIPSLNRFHIIAEQAVLSDATLANHKPPDLSRDFCPIHV